MQNFRNLSSTSKIILVFISALLILGGIYLLSSQRPDTQVKLPVDSYQQSYPAVSSTTSSQTSAETSSTTSATEVKTYTTTLKNTYSTRKITIAATDAEKVYVRVINDNTSQRESLYVNADDYFFSFSRQSEGEYGYVVDNKSTINKISNSITALVSKGSLVYKDLSESSYKFVPGKYSQFAFGLKFFNSVDTLTCAKAKANINEGMVAQPSINCKSNDRVLGYSTSYKKNKDLLEVYCLYENEAGQEKCINVFRSIKLTKAANKTGELKLGSERELNSI